MKAYTYPINYTEMCPYSGTVAGTLCISMDISNRLTISKLDLKKSIIGKTIYFCNGFHNPTPQFYLFKAIIIGIYKNIITISRTSLTRGPAYTNKADDIGYFSTDYYDDFIDSRQHKRYTSRNIFFIGETINELSDLPISIKSYMNMFSKAQKVLPSLCNVYNSGTAISGKLEFNIEIIINGISIIPTQSYILIQSTDEFIDQDIKSMIWEGNLNPITQFKVHTEFNIKYAFIIILPPELELVDDLNILVKTTITDIDLYEHKCINMKTSISPHTYKETLMINRLYNITIDNYFMYDD